MADENGTAQTKANGVEGTNGGAAAPATEIELQAETEPQTGTDPQAQIATPMESEPQKEAKSQTETETQTETEPLTGAEGRKETVDPQETVEVPSKAVWPYASPPLYTDMLITIVCGNTRCHWAIHNNYQQDFYPILFWKTGLIEKWDKEKQSREEWMNHYMPPMAFQRLFGTAEGPSAAQLTAAFATRKVSLCPVYIIATNDGFMGELVQLLETMPTRIILLQSEDFERKPYPGCGVDRVANLHGAESKYGRPALVIDGGTALTWTASDAKGYVRGGGIAPGLAMKFKAMSAFTDKLPDLDFNEVHDRIKQCAEQEKAIKLYATNTSDAMMTSVLRETALLLAHIVRNWTKELANKKVQEKKSRDVFICLTGGDAQIFEKLLSKDRGHIIQTDKHGMAIPPEAKIMVEKNIIHEGISSLLFQKTVPKKNLTKEELGRSNCIGQRVAISKDSKVLRGSVVEVVRGETVKDDKFKVILEDHSTSILDATQTCAALNLYAEKGESEEVESFVAAMLEKLSDQDKGKSLPPTIKKGRSKLAAEWITALVEGKPFEDPEGPPPGADVEDEKTPAKRKSTALSKSSQKKARKDTPPIDKASIEANPKEYVGCRVAKFFDDDLYFGTIKKYVHDPQVALWKVVYDDNDKEDYDVDDMVEYLKLHELRRDDDPKT